MHKTLLASTLATALLAPAFTAQAATYAIDPNTPS